MTFKEAKKACRKVGTAHAAGDALRAMYADLIAHRQGGDAETYYVWLPRGDDGETMEAARSLLRDRAKAWDVLMGRATT